jgi:hypothetical protein
MVTILDSGLLNQFSIIFSMVLVIAVVYGILQFTKTLGDSKGLHALIAFILSLMLILVPDVSAVISTMLPWFTFFFIFLLCVIIGVKVFGATDADIAGVLKAGPHITWVIIIVAAVIVVGSFASVYGSKLLPVTTDGSAPVQHPGDASVASGNFAGNVGATFFHPSIIGTILIFLVAVFTVAILAQRADS